MIRKILFFSTVLALGACAYAMDDSIQDVRIETPGAQNAKCAVYVDGLKYVAYPPQTLNIFKSKKPLEVDCMAPGNRRKAITVEAGIERSTFYNTTNLGAGVPLDYATNSMFRYPDVIAVDFTDVALEEFDHPAHDNPALRQSETYKLEEFSPGVPRLNSDSGIKPPVLLRRGEPAPASSDESASAFTEPAHKRSDKGDLHTVIERLSPSMNPSSAPAAQEEGSAKSAPTPLFPGQ